MGLGDIVEKALTYIGVTKDRVEAWVGAPCNCAERQAKLNALGWWAKRTLVAAIANPFGWRDKAKKYLEDTLQ